MASTPQTPYHRGYQDGWVDQQVEQAGADTPRAVDAYREQVTAVEMGQADPESASDYWLGYYHGRTHARTGEPTGGALRRRAKDQREGDEVLERIYTSRSAAETLGVSINRIGQLARSRDVGKQVGGRWIFTDADIDAMRVRIPGRPAQDRDVE